MPTREEIATWLREQAAKEDRIWAELSPESAARRSGRWEQRASQVEAMRCETCEREYERIHDPMGEIEKVIECPWRGCGGCFNHEEKQ